MKKIIRIYIAIIASVCLFMSLPADIYAVVIDVSSYNGFIQWDNMKNYIEGTIIRIGYGSDIQSQDDAAAIRNMDECERLGIPYGVYLYSYALDYYDAASETAHALDFLKEGPPNLVCGLIWKMLMDIKQETVWMYTPKANCCLISAKCLLMLCVSADIKPASMPITTILQMCLTLTD